MTFQSLLDANIEALSEGSELLQMLGSEQYQSGFKPAFQATIGSHFRHVIEHYRCLFSQIEEGVFCYDKRERDEILESDRAYALRSLGEIINQLRKIERELFARQYKIVDHLTTTPLVTTLQRELLFLQSHTVHHYAMIAAMTRAQGVQPMGDFGVAIATIKHRDETNKSSEAAPREAHVVSETTLSSTRSRSCAR